MTEDGYYYCAVCGEPATHWVINENWIDWHRCDKHAKTIVVDDLTYISTDRIDVDLFLLKEAL